MAVNLDISFYENSVPKAFANWVRINQGKDWIGSQVADLLSQNDLEAALWLYNTSIWDIIFLEWGDPANETLH